MWHKADWDKVKADPKSIQLPRQDWIFKHDARKYAEENFEDALRNLSRPQCVDGSQKV